MNIVFLFGWGCHASGGAYAVPVTETPKTLASHLTVYRYNVSDPDAAKDYEDLCKILKKRGLRKTEILSMQGDRFPLPGPITIETEHLFSDQWNTSPGNGSTTGWRVFNWREKVFPNPNIKEGYYLDVTDEMKAALDNTLKCGYCWNHAPLSSGLAFCYKCLGSAHLKESELYLLRMLPVSAGFGVKRAPLTDAEKAHLVPQYVECQTRGKASRAVEARRKQRERVVAALETAKTEAEGLLWLLDHDVSTYNVLYYNHRKVFTFGWREPVSDSVAQRLLDTISEFPFPYEIKGTSQTWESY